MIAQSADDGHRQGVGADETSLLGNGPRVPGGIMVFLCSNLGNGPAGTPACPTPSGTVTGTLTPASVIGPTAQNITPGNFQGLVTALTTQTSYGNIHTTQFPAGEIRGDIVQCPGSGC